MKRRSRRRKSSHRLTFIAGAGLVALVVLTEIAAERSRDVLLSLGAAALAAIVAAMGLWWHRRRQRSREARMTLLRMQRLGDLLTASGAEFESMVAELFRALGYTRIERIGGSGDLGIDLSAIDPDGLEVVIQCKRYGRGQKIGSPAVQNLMGAVVNADADRGIFVTTSEFTEPAIRHARSVRVPISLINGDELTRLAVEVFSGAEGDEWIDDELDDETMTAGNLTANRSNSTRSEPQPRSQRGRARVAS